MERFLQSTADGSYTISIPAMEVTYHSKIGAIMESQHVFIDAGLKYHLKQQNPAIDILEIGFGTGLNALLTLIEAGQAKISYQTIEPYPLETPITTQLNYCDLLERPDLIPAFTQMHNCTWGKEIKIIENFSITKQKTALENFETNHRFNLIYFDAFAPLTQPDLWTTEQFRKLFNCLQENGCLVTYCSKTVVRRSMEAAGFIVEKIPGPFGKREMVRAIKTSG